MMILPSRHVGITRRSRSIRMLLIALGAASSAAASRGAAAQGATLEQGEPHALGAPVAQASSATLRPGDALRLRVWREPDLSGDFMVDEHGELTLPRLGRRSVLAVPIDSVRARVVQEYGQFLRDATIEVTPLYRVRVTGAVRNPGLFTVDPTMSVADALGLAGGVGPQGKRGKVSLVRDGRRIDPPVPLGARLVELALRSGDELYVPETSWLSRNTGIAIGAVSAAASLVWAFRR